MPHINLLPWREEAQRLQQQQYLSILAFLALSTFLVFFLISSYFQARIDGQQARNQYLTNEIKILDTKIAEINTLEQKKKDLIQRMKLIEQLQKSRNVGTQVLDEMAKIVPSGIYLVRVEKNGAELSIIGKSESNNHLANMIREVQSSELLTDAELESITASTGGNTLLSDFKMTLRIKGLLDDEERINANRNGSGKRKNVGGR
ncbi:PilN domain-containing protein [Thalassotalea litorea]|uniref:PilN domain-containing protein n=1 Tax=Thalassotalea litorea TaxID=2020715 RepID=A0A5R9IBT3_9GAMM|nr:PilN domain-containing protein [Thalassotalea litorea]TLU61066.1 PilN domain-containing protein [Thalassotalea litorea]